MATTPTPASSEGKKSRLLLIVALSVALTAGAAGAAWYFLLRPKGPAVAEVKPPAEPIFVALDPFTVNLQPNSRNRFLHVAITLKADDAKSQAQLVQYLPEVRSRILTTLSNRSAEKLATPEEKSQLAGEILTALKQPFVVNLPAAGISSVMFTTFMLQ